jgi:hypothetical protein
MKQRKIAGTIVDATLPKTPIEIDGKIYNLCFTLGALAEAETSINAELAREGRNDFVNLLFALPPVGSLANTRIVFAAAVRTFHPELTFEQACELPGLSDLYEVANKVRAAWYEATVKDKDEPAQNPNEPAAAVA